MFTLIRNYRTLFMMCIANYQQMEAGNAFDTDASGSISLEEYEALLVSPEARAIEASAQVDALEAAVDVASTVISEEVTFDTSISTIEEKTVQFLTSKIIRLRGGTPADSSLDGNIGRNSKRDITTVL